MTWRYSGFTILAAGLLFFGQSAARAQSSTGTAERSNPGTASGTPDQVFVNNAARAGQGEVEMAKLALLHTGNEATKKFANQMIDDHTRAGDQLKMIATQKNITVPTTLSGKDQEEMHRLEQLQGAAFDRAYIRYQVAAHREAVAEFDKEAKSGKDPDFKNFASQTLPTLRQHLQMAEMTERELK